MKKLFLFGIGGTGARVVKSLTLLLASGIRAKEDFQIVPILIDPHKDNEDLKRTIALLNNYEKISTSAGISNGFFGTAISTLQSLDADHQLGGSYTFDLKQIANTRFKDYLGYNTMDEENQALADLLFSGVSINEHGAKIDLLDIPMDIGFVGNPNVGSVVLNQFKDAEEFRAFDNNFNHGDRIFIISSIFGGTGAAGFPTILKNIRNAVHIPGLTNSGYLQNAAIGAVTVMPYFNIEGDETSPIKKSDFIEKTKAALSYYQKNVNPAVNLMYYVGDDFTGKPYVNDPGNGGQKNKAHVVEVAAALAVLDFMNTPNGELHTENGRPVNAVAKEYGLKEDQFQLFFSHLGDHSRRLLAQNLTQFVLFKKFLDEHFEQGLEKQPWSTSEPLLTKSFANSVFFSSNLKSVMAHFEEWLNELEANSRSFAPFNLKASIHALINGQSPKVNLFGWGKISFDLFDIELNRTAKKGDYQTAEQKMLRLFYQTTATIADTKF